MINKEILNKFRNMTLEEQRKTTYEELKEILFNMTMEERIELANIIGYPVFIRLCMNELAHVVPILQDGAAVIIINEKGQVLLQSRADRNKWGLPGGCQDLKEEIKETAIREVKEETNLDIAMENLELIDWVSGEKRRNNYPNGDTVFNNTALFCTTKYSGELKWDFESKEMRWFDLDNLPENQNDPDLIDIYKTKKLIK